MKLHSFEPEGAGVRCVICGNTWRSYPHSAECPGVPIYKGARSACPPGLITKWEIAQIGLGELIEGLPEPVGIWDSGDGWRQLFVATALVSWLYGKTPSLQLVTSHEVMRLGLHWDVGMCNGIYQDEGGRWLAYTYPPANLGLDMWIGEERPDHMLTAEELHDAGYSTAKTKIPPPRGIFREEGGRCHLVYDEGEAKTRRMNKAQRAALELATAYSRRTDDIEIALWYAYGGRETLDVQVSAHIFSPRSRGWVCKAVVQYVQDGEPCRKRMTLGNNRREVFAFIREAAAGNGYAIDWRRVSGDWELQKEVYCG